MLPNTSLISLPRFYVAPDAWNPHALRLDDRESHHCLTVRRKEVGDEIVVFNGKGDWVRARITAVEQHRVVLAPATPHHTPTPAVSLALLQAIPKGSNMELIIEKAVELGVNSIYPVVTQHTVVRLDEKAARKKQEKWQQIALEACKQCGQNWLPEVHTPMPYTQAWKGMPPQDLRIIAAIEPDSQPLKTLLTTHHATKANTHSVLMVVGPEGDFSAEEYALAREHGCLPMTLGPIILRVETAAMFSLSVLNHELHRHAR